MLVIRGAYIRGAYIRRGLIFGGLIFGILRYLNVDQTNHLNIARLQSLKFLTFFDQDLRNLKNIYCFLLFSVIMTS